MEKTYTETHETVEPTPVLVMDETAVRGRVKITDIDIKGHDLFVLMLRIAILGFPVLITAAMFYAAILYIIYVAITGTN